PRKRRTIWSHFFSRSRRESRTRLGALDYQSELPRLTGMNTEGRGGTRRNAEGKGGGLQSPLAKMEPLIGELRVPPCTSVYLRDLRVLFSSASQLILEAGSPQEGESASSLRGVFTGFSVSRRDEAFLMPVVRP